MRFGMFQVEKISMPAAAQDLTDTYLFAKDYLASESTEGKHLPYQFDVDYAMWLLKQKMRSPNENYHRENPGSPAMLELWHFALRHYLNLNLSRGLFGSPRRPHICNVYGGEKWAEGKFLLVQIGLKYNSGVISGVRENN